MRRGSAAAAGPRAPSHSLQQAIRLRHHGGDVELADAQRAAELCAINILAQAKAALSGDLSRISRVVKLNGFVASAPGFIEQHLVINGASNLIANVLGDAGKHARAAVGVAQLPLNAAVEIDAILEIAL